MTALATLALLLAALPQESGREGVEQAQEPAEAPQELQVPVFGPPEVERTPAEEEPVVEHPLPAPLPAPPPELDRAAVHSPEEIEAALTALARTWPDLVAVETIGTSAEGRPILAAAIGATEALRNRAPALLVGDHAQGGRTEGGDACLFLADALARRAAEGDSALRAALGTRVLYVAPALDPDRRARLVDGEAGDAGGDAAVDAGGGARFEHDFPIGWRPAGLQPRSGPYPLALPETRALVAWLDAHPNVSVALGFRARPSDPRDRERGESLPRATPVAADLAPGDRDLQLQLASAWIGWELDSNPALIGMLPGPPEGDWLDDCYGRRGIYTLVATFDGEGGAPPAGDERRIAIESSVPRVLDLVACLPRLEFGSPVASRLGEGLWQIDAPLRNRGVLPSLSHVGRERHAAGGVVAELDPALLVAAGRSRPEAASSSAPGAPGAAVAIGEPEAFSVLRPAEGRLALGQLEGGGSATLRLLVEAVSGAEVHLVARSPRAGSTELTVVLP